MRISLRVNSPSPSSMVSMATQDHQHYSVSLQYSVRQSPEKLVRYILGISHHLVFDSIWQLVWLAMSTKLCNGMDDIFTSMCLEKVLHKVDG